MLIAQEVIYIMFVLSTRPHNCKSYSIVVLIWYLLINDILLLLVFQVNDYTLVIFFILNNGLYFWRPPLVLAEKGSYCSYPPPVVLGYEYMLDILNQTTRSRITSSTSLSCPRMSRPLSLASFLRRRSRLDFPSPSLFSTKIFQAIVNDGNNCGISPYQKNLMFSEWLDKDYIIAGSQHLRPPRGSTPGHELCPIFHPRSRNNHYGFERLEGFSRKGNIHFSPFLGAKWCIYLCMSQIEGHNNSPIKTWVLERNVNNRYKPRLNNPICCMGPKITAKHMQGRDKYCDNTRYRGNSCESTRSDIR